MKITIGLNKVYTPNLKELIGAKSHGHYPYQSASIYKCKFLKSPFVTHSTNERGIWIWDMYMMLPEIQPLLVREYKKGAIARPF